jgi:small-conductance mechanosensitive channel
VDERGIPPPDPTALTNDALRREIALLRKSLNRRFEGIEAELNSRLQSGEKLMNVKFRSVEQRFVSNAEQRSESQAATTTAVAAALQAQKEAVAKSEAATSKQLEQLTVTFETRGESLRRSIDENKERLTSEARELRAAIASVDAKVYGSQQQRRGSDTTRTMTFGLIAAIVGVAGVILAIVAFAAR